MLHRWRKEFQANAESRLDDKRNPKQKAHSQGYEPRESPDDLKKIIGELMVQNEILKSLGAIEEIKTTRVCHLIDRFLEKEASCDGGVPANRNKLLGGNITA